MLSAYETLYGSYIWSNRDQMSANLIQEISTVTSAPLTANQAGAKFLQCCLTQIVFDADCHCQDIQEKHNYYQHLVAWFFIVVSERLKDSGHRFANSVISVLNNPVIPLKNKLDTLMILILPPHEITDPIIASMFLTVTPYLRELFKTADKDLYGEVCRGYAVQLRTIVATSTPIYVRLSANMPAAQAWRCIVKPDGFDAVDTKGKPYFTGKISLNNWDLRGCKFNYINWDGFTLTHTDCSETEWRNCQAEQIIIGDNCNFYNAIANNNLSFIPPMPRQRIGCFYF